MTCDEVRRHWNLYHDSEGDAELHFRIGEHLAICPDCAQWFDQESRLEHLIAERLRSVPATPELWDRILLNSGLARPKSSRRWMILVSVVACAASVAAIWFGITARTPASHGANLAELTASWHERLTDGRAVVPFRSESDLEVERYLRSRVSFPVRCPPRQDAGFAVRGTGVCTLADQPAAFLVGRVDEAPISIFVLPRASLDAFPHLREELRREQTHRGREGPYEMAVSVIDRNVVLVIGQTEPERLLRVLNAYGTYPETHHDRTPAPPPA
jgi:hypothetical protein